MPRKRDQIYQMNKNCDSYCFYDYFISFNRKGHIEYILKWDIAWGIGNFSQNESHSESKKKNDYQLGVSNAFKMISTVSCC